MRFFNKKKPKTTENQKSPNSFDFNVFMQFCQYFDRLRGSECLKRSTRQKLIVQ